jgi:gluconate 2-dehydrogenase gamma chain
MNALGTRRGFLLALGGVSAGTWLSVSWSTIAAAAEHAATQQTPEFFRPDEAVDVDAITAQIIPSGARPGAREAHAAHFIDRALATFLVSQAPAFRLGLADFQQTFRKAHPSLTAFAVAPPGEQVVFLTAVEHTPFFEFVRMLTIVGTLCAPQYGGNYEYAGWKLLGFEAQHVFSPPFGYYDRGYTHEEI